MSAYAVGAALQGRGLARQAVGKAWALAVKCGASTAEQVMATDNISSQRVALGRVPRMNGTWVR
jgi:hypothetical protein